MLDNNFKNKNRLGRKVEEAVMEYYREHIDKKTRFPRVPVKGYDIICPYVGIIEVKEDRLAHSTGNYAIEYQNMKGEPSGLMGTEAGVFVIVDHDNVIMSRSDNLQYVVRSSDDKRTISMGDTSESGTRCMGWLIPRDEILYSPFVTVVDRWFPHWRIINGQLH